MDSLDFDALEERARQILDPGAYAFAACGADDAVTLRDNIAAWRAIRLRPRMLRGVSAVDTATTLLGAPVATPVMLAPTGRHRLYHPEGERATARGAAAAGAAFVLATNSTVTIEDVASERKTAPHWFQLYMTPERSRTEALVDRAAAAGFGAIVLTVDQPVPGHSPLAARNPIAASPDIRHVNLPGAPIARTAYDPSIQNVVAFPTAFADLEWLVARSALPIVVKGILRGDDAARAIGCGAAGIIVSNHGGRHLDTAVATASVLAEVAAAVGAHSSGSSAEIYVDGGIRRGTDIVKALALGARAILVGRPMLWGLATGGAEGVEQILDHLRAELVRAMALCGAAALSEIGPDLIATSLLAPPLPAREIAD